MFIYPYKAGSQSAKELSKALGAKRIKLEGSKFIPRASKTIINWGCSTMPDAYLTCRVLNSPTAVGLCANKLSFFNHLADTDVRIPPFLTCSADVKFENEDVKEGKPSWVARTVLTGHSGAGIVIIEGGDAEVVEAPLYTKYIPKKEEYRVHVFQGEVVDVQRKARSTDVEDENVNWQVRNHANGFIFARNEDHDVPDDVLVQAARAVEACGLDFGAVDVLWNQKKFEAYVIEVNTAPGLTGETLEGYASRFNAL